MNRFQWKWALAVTSAIAAAALALADEPHTLSFTSAQVARGDAIFRAKCAVCHGEGLTGGPGTPPLKGPEFQFAWKGRSAGELLRTLREKMPPGGADTLPDNQYADVIALILQANEVEPGARELPDDRDSLAEMKLFQE